MHSNRRLCFRSQTERSLQRDSVPSEVLCSPFGAAGRPVEPCPRPRASCACVRRQGVKALRSRSQVGSHLDRLRFKAGINTPLCSYSQVCGPLYKSVGGVTRKGRCRKLAGEDNAAVLRRQRVVSAGLHSCALLHDVGRRSRCCCVSSYGLCRSGSLNRMPASLGPESLGGAPRVARRRRR